MNRNFLRSLKDTFINKRTGNTILQSLIWTVTGGAPQESPLGGLLLQVPPFNSFPKCCPVCYIKKNVFPHPTWRRWRGPQGRSLQERSTLVGTVSDTGLSRYAGSSVRETDIPVMHSSSISTLSSSISAPGHLDFLSLPGSTHVGQLQNISVGRRFNLDFVSNSWQCTGHGAYMPSAATILCFETTKYMLQHGPWMTEGRKVSVNTVLATREEFKNHSLPEHPRQWRIPSPPGLPQTLSLTTLTMTSVRVWLSPHDAQDIGIVGIGVSANIHRSMYEDREVIIKVFKPMMRDFLEVLKEADIARFMGTLGVAPPLLGLIRFPGLSLPSIVSASLPGAKDLECTLRSYSHDMPIYDIFNLMAQVARLLTFMHTQGFLHNDIKANNILVVPQFCICPENIPCTCIGVPTNIPAQPRGATGMPDAMNHYRAYLIDFGTSSYRYGYLYCLTSEDRQRMQLFPYLAPEIVYGLNHMRRTTAKTDVYSFGMLLYEVCERYSDARLVTELSDLIKACIKRDPDERPPMADVERVLEMIAIIYKEEAAQESADAGE